MEKTKHQPNNPPVSSQLSLGGVCVCVHSVAQSCLTLETCWTAAHQAPLSMGFFQKRILERVVISCFRGSSNPGVEPESLMSPALAGGCFTTVPPEKPYFLWYPSLLSAGFQERNCCNRFVCYSTLEISSLSHL